MHKTCVVNLNKMVKKGILFCLIFLLLLQIKCVAQAPGWVTNTPVNNEFYIGIGSSKKSYSNYQKRATKEALSEIAEQIQINIKSRNELFVSQNRKGISRDFFQNVVSTSDVQLQDYELYATWGNKDEYYVYYRLSKEKFRENMIAQYDEAITNSNKKISDAKSYFKAGKINAAVGAYLNASKFLEHLIDNSFIQAKHDSVVNNWYNIQSAIIKIANEFEVSPGKSTYAVSKNGIFDTDLSVKTFISGKNMKHSLAQVPVIFKLSHNLNAFYRKSVNSDNHGICKDKIVNIYDHSNNYTVTCKIDFENYFNNFGNYLILQDKAFNKLFSDCSINIHVIPLKVMIKSTELIYSSPRNFPAIKNEVSDYLRRHYFSISKSVKNSDYLIKIKANTRRGTYYDGIYSAFLTVEYSIINRHTGKTVYNGNIDNVKGVSLSYDAAAEKAYDNFKEDDYRKLIQSILPYLK